MPKRKTTIADDVEVEYYHDPLPYEDIPPVVANWPPQVDEAGSIYEQEQAIEGPDLLGLTCEQTGCEARAHCGKSFLGGKCQLKEAYLQNIAKAVGEVLDGSTTLLDAPALQVLPVADILHDISTSNYFGICIDARAIVNQVVASQPSYVDELALVYLIIIAHKKFKKGFPGRIVLKVLNKAVSFSQKADTFRLLASGLDHTGKHWNKPVLQK